MAEDLSPAAIVTSAYNHIADWYLDWTAKQPSTRDRYTKNLLSQLPASPSTTPKILDLGCGPGVPILPLLVSHGAVVIANDISPTQIALAKARFPHDKVRFVEGDMLTCLSSTLQSESLDAVVSFFTLFHLPRSQLSDMLRTINSWLKPGGLFAFNLATFDEEEIHGEMHGHGMFWSSFALGENKALVGGAGFEIMECEILKAGEEGGRENLEEGDADYEAEFMWVLARKTKIDVEGLLAGGE